MQNSQGSGTDGEDAELGGLVGGCALPWLTDGVAGSATGCWAARRKTRRRLAGSRRLSVRGPTRLCAERVTTRGPSCIGAAGGACRPRSELSPRWVAAISATTTSATAPSTPARRRTRERRGTPTAPLSGLACSDPRDELRSVSVASEEAGGCAVASRAIGTSMSNQSSDPSGSDEGARSPAASSDAPS
jgi:hypothetical protein